MTDNNGNAPDTSSSPAPLNYNITRVIPSHNTPEGAGSNKGRPNMKYASGPHIREIAPLTEYNPETGNLDVRKDSPWGARSEEPAPPETPAAAAAAAATPDRHTAWKAEQAAQKAAREAARVEKAGKTQALAKDLLRKGDIASAAHALGMSPTDFITYVDNARLQIPNEEKKLSPEEERSKLEESYRKKVEDVANEFNEYRFKSEASNYIRDNISPEISNKEKYEMIHQGNVTEIQSYVYDYILKHYNETGGKENGGEVLHAKDVLETIEEEMYQSNVKALEKARTIKKVAKFFAPQETPAPGAKQEPGALPPETKKAGSFEITEPTLANKTARPLDSRFPVQGRIDFEDTAPGEDEADALIQQLATERPKTGAKKTFAFLSPAEKMAIIRAERERGE